LRLNPISLSLNTSLESSGCALVHLGRMNPNAFNVSTKPHFHTAVGPDSLSHNFLISGPNLMNQVSYESLKSLFSNPKGFTGFG